MKFAIANPLETSLVEDLIDHYVHTELSEGASLPLRRDKNCLSNLSQQMESKSGLSPIRKLSSRQQLQRNGKQECLSLSAKSPNHSLIFPLKRA